jgi:hypothetical protein
VRQVWRIAPLEIIGITAGVVGTAAVIGAILGEARAGKDAAAAQRVARGGGRPLEEDEKQRRRRDEEARRSGSSSADIRFGRSSRSSSGDMLDDPYDASMGSRLFDDMDYW